MVQLEMIACFCLLPCPRDFSRKPFHIIVIRRGNLLICMVAALLQAQGRENGRQQGAKCAFSLNNPFNLSSIMWRQLGALILLQFERSVLEITSSRSRVGGGGVVVEVWSCRKVAIESWVRSALWQEKPQTGGWNWKPGENWKRYFTACQLARLEGIYYKEQVTSPF